MRSHLKVPLKPSVSYCRNLQGVVSWESLIGPPWYWEASPYRAAVRIVVAIPDWRKAMLNTSVYRKPPHLHDPAARSKPAPTPTLLPYFMTDSRFSQLHAVFIQDILGTINEYINDWWRYVEWSLYGVPLMTRCVSIATIGLLIVVEIVAETAPITITVYTKAFCQTCTYCKNVEEA